MSSHNMATLRYISNKKLADMIRNKVPNVTVIDVRDSDYIGGHILGCMNVPTNQHDYRMPELVRTLKDQDAVVFHCALSQQRGPSSALRYLRERDKMLQKGEIGARTDEKALDQAQTVYVLEGGFVKWQQLYGTDVELTEGYVKDLWEDD